MRISLHSLRIVAITIFHLAVIAIFHLSWISMIILLMQGYWLALVLPILGVIPYLVRNSLR